MKKVYVFFLWFVFVGYFMGVVLFQIYDQNLIHSEIVGKAKQRYALPFFEQSWAMFAPNPPMGNRYFVLKFQTKDQESDFIDINQGVREGSFRGLFSIDQRVVKYFAECYNDIVRCKGEGINIEKDVHLSHGLESIVNYSKFVLDGQSDFLNKVNKKDSIFVKIYLVDERLNDVVAAEDKYTKTYVELDRIYLKRKDVGK